MVTSKMRSTIKIKETKTTPNNSKLWCVTKYCTKNSFIQWRKIRLSVFAFMNNWKENRTNGWSIELLLVCVFCSFAVIFWPSNNVRQTYRRAMGWKDRQLDGLTDGHSNYQVVAQAPIRYQERAAVVTPIQISLILQLSWRNMHYLH